MKAMITIYTTGVVDLTFWKDEQQRREYAKSIAAKNEHVHFNVYDVPEN